MAVAVSEEICLLSALHFWLFRQGEEEIKKTTLKKQQKISNSLSLFFRICCVYSTESIEEDGRDGEEEYYHEKQRH